MARTTTLLLLVAAALLPASCSACEVDIRMPTSECDSWVLGVEAHNVRDWKTVPASCEGYVGHYMLGKHFRRDSKVVVDQALAYVDSLKLAGNGEEVWVFDIDETTLSNLPYYAKHGFGATPFNATSFNAYVLEDAGYVIVGNFGDQWSDILGAPAPSSYLTPYLELLPKSPGKALVASRIDTVRPKAPPAAYAKVHVDAAVAKIENRGAAVAVCRDTDGNYMGSSVLVVHGITDVAILEAIACREGLALAQDLMLQNFVLASDSKQIVSDI
ncbi:Acid phosphatase 1 [Triticum urartu]|uniref:Acid phosphatase 1 n=1 Tax=Triticum urartu TaxID=4572 RepID=M8ABP1_TRIUA|nr:Acid phosphatase 1 [Triticum urartu]